jgi:hypothetical protein
VEQKAHKRLRGIVLDPHREPMPGALIEVFTNPDYLLHDGPQNPEEKASRRESRRAALGQTERFASVPSLVSMKCVFVYRCRLGCHQGLRSG